jgi:queuine tRNA-ribosyltransferase
VIFYDPFSTKTDSALWVPAVFERMFAHCGTKATELFTYSSATAVRVALLAGGFLVGEGVSTGPRAATTVAMTRLNGAHHGNEAPKLLGADWLARWRRSDAKFPASLPMEARAEFERRIEQHPQFARLA